MKLIAVTAIERVLKPGKDATATQKRVRPTTEHIAPGEPFEIDDEAGNDLIARKAAVKDKDAKPTKAKNTKTSATAAAQQQQSQDGGEQKAVEDMTKDEIKEELDEREVEYDGRASKTDLADVLTTARADTEDMV